MALSPERGGLSIIGKLNNESGTQSWKFHSLGLKSISIDIDQGQAFALKGSLNFYKNDAVYGNGFNGLVDAKFISKLQIKASVIFGSKDGERYWYADAMIKLPKPINVAGPVCITGFGGGACYGMKMAPTAQTSLGRTASGISYAPASENGMSFKAIVFLSTNDGKVLNADVTLEIAFFKGGGIHSITFLGNAVIAASVQANGLSKLSSAVNKLQAHQGALEINFSKRKLATFKITEDKKRTASAILGDQLEGPITAKIFISFDFSTSEFHSTLDAKINVAGGVITGSGQAVLHFAPGEWYVYVGTPPQPFGVNIGIGSFSIGVNAYFMAGSVLPGSPPPPPEVSSILNSDMNYMKDLNAISKGGGFAFGMALKVDTGDIQFLIFYGHFKAGLGFDIMLKDYGNTYCAGKDERVGVNGWYANGQAYAYVEGEIGIRVRIFRRNRSISILSIALAAALQAKLPNPTWAKGIVGGQFRILGGIIKGNCKFELTIGNECRLITKANADTNPLSDIAVIAQLTPGEGEQDINVFNNPQAVFNMAVNKEFNLSADDKDRTYRIKLEQYNLTANGQAIGGNIIWNADNTVAAFNSFDILPPKANIKFEVKVSFEELKGGSWATVQADGQPYAEQKTVTFASGAAPDFIPTSNIAYSYPIINQLNYYKKESSAGYIRLLKGQDYLFAPEAEWTKIGRIKNTAGEIISFNISYDVANNQVNYTLPEDKLALGAVYSLLLVKAPASGHGGAIDRNVKDQKQEAQNNEGNKVEVTTKKAEGAINQLEEKNIYEMRFRASQYASVREKLNSLTFRKAGTWMLSTGVMELSSSVQGSELFDKNELVSSAYENNKVLLLEHDGSSQWMKNSVVPLLYEGYPWSGNMTIRNRNTNLLGVPPARAVYMRQAQTNLSLSDDNAENYSYPVTIANFVFNLPKEVAADYADLRSRAADLSVTQNDSRLTNLIRSRLPIFSEGDYKVNIKHRLPGVGTVTSVNPITIDYSVLR